MGTRDPRVDAYIASSADFARPVLEHILDTVHAASPTVVETIKWNFPHFARRDETKARRVAQALEWLADGKRRNWRYEQ